MKEFNKAFGHNFHNQGPTQSPLDKKIDKIGRAKLFWICYGVTIVLLIIVMVITYRAHTFQSYVFNETSLRVTSVSPGRGRVKMRDRDGNVLTMTRAVINEDDLSRLFGGPNEFVIQYMGSTMTYVIRRDADNARYRVFSFSDGSEAMAFMPPPVRSPGTELDDRYILTFKTDLQQEEAALFVWLINHLNAQLSAGYYAVPVLLGLVIMPVALGLFLYTEAFWRFSMMFTVIGGEPTQDALFIRRVGGVILMIIVFGFPLLFIL